MHRNFFRRILLGGVVVLSLVACCNGQQQNGGGGINFGPNTGIVASAPAVQRYTKMMSSPQAKSFRTLYSCGFQCGQEPLATMTMMNTRPIVNCLACVMPCYNQMFNNGRNMNQQGGWQQQASTTMDMKNMWPMSSECLNLATTAYNMTMKSFSACMKQDKKASACGDLCHQAAAAKAGYSQNPQSGFLLQIINNRVPDENSLGKILGDMKSCSRSAQCCTQMSTECQGVICAMSKLAMDVERACYIGPLQQCAKQQNCASQCSSVVDMLQDNYSPPMMSNNNKQRAAFGIIQDEADQNLNDDVTTTPAGTTPEQGDGSTTQQNTQ